MKKKRSSAQRRKKEEVECGGSPTGQKETVFPFCQVLERCKKKGKSLITDEAHRRGEDLGGRASLYDNDPPHKAGNSIPVEKNKSGITKERETTQRGGEDGRKEGGAARRGGPFRRK